MMQDARQERRASDLLRDGLDGRSFSLSPAPLQASHLRFAIDAFRLRAWARAILWRQHVIDLHDAVDVLAADAERDGIDVDLAQQIMAEEFGAVR